MKEDLELKNLDQYRGTEQYFCNPLFKEINYTDGVKYVSDNGYAWLVTDILAVIKGDRKVKTEPFLSIEFTQEDEKGKVVIGDGNGVVLYRQMYKYTSAKSNVGFFYTDQVLMLKGEY